MVGSYYSEQEIKDMIDKVIAAAIEKRKKFERKVIEEHMTEKNYGTPWANSWRKSMMEDLDLI